MDRLTVRDDKGKAHMICKQMCGDYGNGCDRQIDVDMCQKYAAFDKLADYEDLEEQGLLVKLPCKVGDTVYVVVGKYISKQKIQRITIDSVNIIEFCTRKRGFSLFDIGTKVFLTQDQADKALE